MYAKIVALENFSKISIGSFEKMGNEEGSKI